jgi:predicted nucleic acid-binding protein
MRYVLDSNVGLKWFLRETDSDKAIRIRDDFLRQVHDLITPDVFALEIAHALTRAQRQGRITVAEGQSHFGDMIATLPTLYPSLPLLPRAYQLSSLAQIGVCDCLYAALIEQEACELITADERLRRSLPSHQITLLSSMP